MAIAFQQQFPLEAGGVIGVTEDGRVDVDGFISEDRGRDPIGAAIRAIQDPTEFARMIARARTGDASAFGYYEGENVAGLEIIADGVQASLDLPDDSYEAAMGFGAFEPVLAAWQQAWAAAQG